jgi:hypothetical protein
MLYFKRHEHCQFCINSDSLSKETGSSQRVMRRNKYLQSFLSRYKSNLEWRWRYCTTRHLGVSDRIFSIRRANFEVLQNASEKQINLLTGEKLTKTRTPAYNQFHEKQIYKNKHDPRNGMTLQNVARVTRVREKPSACN